MKPLKVYKLILQFGSNFLALLPRIFQQINLNAKLYSNCFLMHFVSAADWYSACNSHEWLTLQYDQQPLFFEIKGPLGSALQNTQYSGFSPANLVNIYMI